MKQLHKNRLIILILFAMTVVPFLIAFAFKENPLWLSKRSNYGQLIVPPVTTDRQEFTGFDVLSAEHLNELKGHWVIVNAIPTPECGASCRDAIHKTRQLQLMLNKDLTRTRRAVLMFEGLTEDAANRPWLEDKALLKIKPQPSLIDKIAKIRAGRLVDGMMLLMDPLGNLMMQYEPGFDPYRVKTDLSHLLKISQIG